MYSNNKIIDNDRQDVRFGFRLNSYLLTKYIRLYRSIIICICLAHPRAAGYIGGSKSLHL